MKNNYKLLIFDDQYCVVSDESEAHLFKAASIIDALMKESCAKASQMDEKRIAVLVALQMASKVLALESEIADTSARHKALIDRIEHEYLALVRSY